MELVPFLISVIVITLSGALMPGPTMAATIAKSYQSKSAGSKIALGHGIVEFPLLFLVYFGFADLFRSEQIRSYIGLIGGLILVWMGIKIIIGKSAASRHRQNKDMSHDPILAGIITTIGNPSFFLWWATVGLAFIAKSAVYGLAGFILLAAAHWLCDFGVYSLIGLFIYRTKHLYNNKFQENLLGLCGLMVAGFGVWFMWSAISGLF